MFLRFAQSLLAVRHGSNLAGQAELAEADQVPGQHAVLEARQDGENRREIRPGLADAHPADDVGEHVLVGQRQAAVAMQGRQVHADTLGIEADGDAPGVATPRFVHERLQLHQ